MYDKNNIFAKIARGEIPTRVVYQNTHAMSFYDIEPMCDTHVLVIPRGEYENALDFAHRASDAEKLGLIDCLAKTADKLGVSANYNIMANAGLNAPMFKQSVFHFHLHLIAGTPKPIFEKMVRCLCK